ncbi:MAG: DUF5689 domain-containing protein, partial [Bacteroidales bacterium]
NCYKYLTVEDETGGIEIAIDQTGLFNVYPVGQKVFIDCRGLVIGDYGSKPQIGWIYEGSVGRINSLFLNRYLYKDSLPKPVAPILLSQLSDFSAQNVNRLVKIENCVFSSEANGLPLATNDVTVDRAVNVNGFTFYVRTSNYAKFRNTIIDANSGYSLTGILSVYNGKYQLALRTKDDIVKTPIHEPELVKALTFDQNSLTSGGWSVYPANSPTKWSYSNSLGSQFMYHLNNEIICDDWLISPDITLTDFTGVSMFLDHKIQFAGNINFYQVLYSTTYTGGNINEDDWTPFNALSEFPGNDYALSNALDISGIHSNTFRIAIRYNKYTNITSSRWQIRGVKFYKE